MRRFSLSLILLSLIVLVVNAASAVKIPDFTEVKGVIHCHSAYSDGSGTVEQIATAANQAGLDFLVLSDHNTLQGLIDGKEGWQGSTLILISQETSTPVGHLLSLNVPKDFDVKDKKTAQEMIDGTRNCGGIPILAHAVEGHWPWRDWNVTGYAGFETVNLAEMTLEHKKQLESLALEMIPFNHINYRHIYRVVLEKYPEVQLRKFDLLSAKTKLVMSAGSDAHARIQVGKKVYNIPPYKETFEALQTHLLLPEPLNKNLNHDKKLVYEAISKGHSFIGFDEYGTSTGFRFIAIGEKSAGIMGDSLPYQEGMHLNVSTAIPAEIAPDKISLRILRNSRVVATVRGTSLDYIPDRPGTYRAEAWTGEGSMERVWILSNPIFLTRM